MGDGRVYEGHSFVFGQDNDTDPSALEPSTASRAINRIFRGGKNRTRPPFIHCDFIFDDTSLQYEDIVRFGNFQGWMPYKKKLPGREDGIIVAIGGSIFFLTLVNESWFCRQVATGNDPRLLHTWFVQAQEWVYIQNGKDRPIFWNGLFPSTARRSDPALKEMPVGTIMAYAHGRVFLSNPFDQIAASDIIYGNGLTRSDATQFFTENEYWNEGGYFGQPTELGKITGMVVMPRQDQNIRGTGELVVLSEEGATAIEASVSRRLWKESQIQTVTLSGRGCVAPASLILVNNDCWFRSDDGLASYQVSRVEQKRQLSFGKLSRHANAWFDEDTPWLIRFNSMVYFDNRVLSTVSPFLAEAKDEKYGSHRYHRGIVALDIDQASGTQGDAGFNWDGLWTGIRPCALLKLGKRAFAFSYDVDGENRIYEITRSGLNDEIYGRPVSTKWFYHTKRWDWKNTQRSNEFEVKKLVGGELWISEVRDQIKVGVDYRNDNSPCWTELNPNEAFGSKFTGQWKFSSPRGKRFKFPTPQERCVKGDPYPSNHGSQHQIMVYGEGYMRIDRMRVAMAAVNDPNSNQANCKPDDPNISVDLGCKLSDDYSYEIADSR